VDSPLNGSLQYEIKNEPYSLSKVAQEAELKKKAAYKNIMDADPTKVKIDPNQFEEIKVPYINPHMDKQPNPVDKFISEQKHGPPPAPYKEIYGYGS